MADKQRVKREKAGRPKANIDWAVVKKLLQSGCTAVEVCSYLSVDKATLYNRCIADNNLEFSTFYRQSKSKGDALIKVKLFDRAMNSENPAYLIFMAKARLKMSEKQKEDAPQSLSVKLVSIPKPDETD
jgi:hypothetical protein